MPGLGAVEIILIIVVIVLLFGARKLPDLARSVGRSMRIFKSEVTEMTNESQSRGENKPQTALNQGDDNDEFWQSPTMQPRQYPQNQAQPQQPQQSQQAWQQQPNPQQPQQPQQNWGQQPNPQQPQQPQQPQNWDQQPNPQQQNWGNPQQPQQGYNYPPQRSEEHTSE